MVRARVVGRLSLPMVGLGIGAAVFLAPGIASADGLDFQISIDGYDLLPTAGNSATATSGMGDWAIAWGDGSSASATNGLGDFAFADGTNAAAFSGGGNFDTAIDIGNNTGDGHLALAGVGDYDLAYIDADNSLATSGGDILDSNFPGSNDIAFIFDPFGVGGDSANVGINDFNTGNFDLGAILFDDNVLNQGASGADYLYDIITTLGTETNAAAASSAGWIADLLALF